MQPIWSRSMTGPDIELAITNIARRWQIKPRAVKLKQEKRIIFLLAQSPKPPPKRTAENPSPTGGRWGNRCRMIQTWKRSRPKGQIKLLPKAAAKLDHSTSRDWDYIVDGRAQYNHGLALVFSIQPSKRYKSWNQQRAEQPGKFVLSHLHSWNPTNLNTLPWDGRVPGSN